jgi:hypothetical protein
VRFQELVRMMVDSDRERGALEEPSSTAS